MPDAPSLSDDIRAYGAQYRKTLQRSGQWFLLVFLATEALVNFATWLATLIEDSDPGSGRVYLWATVITGVTLVALYLMFAVPFLLWRKQRDSLAPHMDRESEAHRQRVKLGALEKEFREIALRKREHGVDHNTALAGRFLGDAIALGAFDGDEFLRMKHTYHQACEGNAVVQIKHPKEDLRPLPPHGHAYIQAMFAFCEVTGTEIHVSKDWDSVFLWETARMVADHIKEFLDRHGFK